MAIKKIETVLVTPELARKWLDLGFRNRPVTASRVTAYANEMTSGLWRETGEPMMLSPDGLIEGQHRCLAVIKSGVAINAVVLHHDTSDVFDVLGTGAVRRGSDVIASRTPNYIIGSAIVRLILSAENRVMGLRSSSSGNKVTNRELLNRWDADADALQLACARAQSVAKAIPGSGSGPVGVFFYAFSSRPWIGDALHGAVTGAGLCDGHPILAVRNRMIAASEKMTPTLSPQRLTLWLMAARALDEGRPLTRLIMPSEFPYHLLTGTPVVVRPRKGSSVASQVSLSA